MTGAEQSWLVVPDTAETKDRLRAALSGLPFNSTTDGFVDAFLAVLRDVGTPATTETCCDVDRCGDEDWAAHRKGTLQPSTRQVTAWPDESGQR